MLTIIGCGNPNRSDDGLGVVVAQRLHQRLSRHPVPGVRVFDCGTAGMEVMFAARGSQALLILDACRSGSTPGSVFEVPGPELESLPEPSYSLHDFRWNHAVSVGRKIFGHAFPTEIEVWLVEAASLELGLELSEPVQKAAQVLYDRALRRIATFAAHRHPPPRMLDVARGMVRIPFETYQKLFGERDAALLMVRDGTLIVIPVDPMAGGILLKQRNANGDRVVDASEFLRAHGLDAVGEHRCEATWNSNLGGMAISIPKGPA